MKARIADGKCKYASAHDKHNDLSLSSYCGIGFWGNGLDADGTPVLTNNPLKPRLG